jgi:hypothetical protein
MHWSPRNISGAIGLFTGFFGGADANPFGQWVASHVFGLERTQHVFYISAPAGHIWELWWSGSEEPHKGDLTAQATGAPIARTQVLSGSSVSRPPEELIDVTVHGGVEDVLSPLDVENVAAHSAPARRVSGNRGCPP